MTVWRVLKASGQSCCETLREIYFFFQPIFSIGNIRLVQSRCGQSVTSDPVGEWRDIMHARVSPSVVMSNPEKSNNIMDQLKRIAFILLLALAVFPLSAQQDKVVDSEAYLL